MRSVHTIYPAEKVNMGGILLDQALPNNLLDQLDPFLLIHHWKNHLPGGDRQKDHGVGPHPHRGFSPVTFVIEGEILHQDSRANRSIVSTGGVQWMNSGKGIIHSERPSANLVSKGGMFEIIQVWINTAAAHKMEQPKYIPLEAKDIPTLQKGKSRIAIISGSFEQKEGALKHFSALNIYRISLTIGEKLKLPAPKNYNTLLYVVEGGLINTTDGKAAFSKDLLNFNLDGDEIEIEGTANTELLFLSGEPLNEPVVAQGPFVMNNETEILYAMRDYTMGKMGVLVEAFDD